jgi:hypothetical protein
MVTYPNTYTRTPFWWLFLVEKKPSLYIYWGNWPYSYLLQYVTFPKTVGVRVGVKISGDRRKKEERMKPKRMTLEEFREFVQKGRHEPLAGNEGVSPELKLISNLPGPEAVELAKKPIIGG